MQDPEKRKWVAGCQDDVVYVSGRTRKPGEMNGKSGNLNYCASQLYPKAWPADLPFCVPDAHSSDISILSVCLRAVRVGACCAVAHLQWYVAVHVQCSVVKQ